MTGVRFRGGCSCSRLLIGGAFLEDFCHVLGQGDPIVTCANCCKCVRKPQKNDMCCC